MLLQGRFRLLQTKPHDRGSSQGVKVAFSHGRQELHSHPLAESKRASNVQQFDKDIGSYMLWDKALKLRAVWDRRAHNQSEITSAVELLEQFALDTITVDSTQGSRGQQLTTLTLICKPDEGDQVAAALLQLTPTTHITATECEQCYLPQHTVPVQTPYGPVDVYLSLAGSRVCKATPDWQQCEQAAATAAAAANGADGDGASKGGVDAAAVAAAAVQGLQAGLADGSVELGTQYLF